MVGTLVRIQNAEVRGREGHVFMYQETKPPPRTHPTIRNHLSAFGTLGT